MHKNINEVELKSDPAAKFIVDTLIEVADEFGETAVFYNFPFYLDDAYDNLLRVRVLFVSETHGISIFDPVDYSIYYQELKRRQEDLSRVDSVVYSKLIKSPLLSRKRRNSLVNQQAAFFFYEYSQGLDEVAGLKDLEFDTLKSKEDIVEFIRNNEGQTLSENQFLEVRAILGGTKPLIRIRDRNIVENDTNSKGALLQTIEAKLKVFDDEQKFAAYHILDGPQRIRGLAGSGKTIILAMKAAIMHLQNEDAIIAYTYYTKALHDTVKRLITRFYRQFSDRDPDWRKIKVFHAWGGYGLEGMYSHICLANNIEPIRFNQAKSANPKEPFDFVCNELLKHNLRQTFDYVLIDEAQDFHSSFYRLCLKSVKNKRVIWAYDDFQNILNINLQDEKKTFGQDDSGEFHIDFDQDDTPYSDIVLHVCYRNPKNVLSTAFALGLGIYNDKILQRLENNKHWEDLGFLVERGNSVAGEEMVISRPEEYSPLIKEEILASSGEVLRYGAHESIDHECHQVAAWIDADIKSKLLPDDISVICLDDRYARRYFSQLTNLLYQKNIDCFDLLEAPNHNIHYAVSERVTLTTVYRAKGNESASVYIMGVDSIFIDKDNVAKRNKLFTAITRSKGWVSITGTGDAAHSCFREIDALRENDFKLVFNMPDEEDIKTIRRDVKENAIKKRDFEKSLEEFAKAKGLSIREVLDMYKEKG